MFEVVILLQVINDLNMRYYICLMTKGDISYLDLAYLMQLMVQTLNETAIRHTNSARDGA